MNIISVGAVAAERERRVGAGLSWGVAALLVTVGVIGLTVCLGAQRSLDDLAANGTPVTSTVLVVGMGGMSPTVTAEYTTADGSTVVAQSNRFDMGVLDLRNGDKLDILYDPADPTRFQGADWSPPRSLPWLGASWLVLAVGLAVVIVVRARSARADSETRPADAG